MTQAVSSKSREHALPERPPERVRLARLILRSRRITLARLHPSRVPDNATAYKNIVQTARGERAKRSSYGGAPGGAVYLDTRILRALAMLRHTFTFKVSEIAGGEHSPNSRHYKGLAFDIEAINGVSVSAANRHVAAFKQRCRGLGAVFVLGPGDDPDHATHVHAQWNPRASSSSD
ncbi:MAG TPA: hypothetical protein VF659_01165 [Pyrinomonadaceae bacterium]|jgi:hypothetical protein